MGEFVHVHLQVNLTGCRIQKSVWGGKGALEPGFTHAHRYARLGVLCMCACQCEALIEGLGLGLVRQGWSDVGQKETLPLHQAQCLIQAETVMSSAPTVTHHMTSGCLRMVWHQTACAWCGIKLLAHGVVT